jgi:hypothetical protein
MNEEIPASVSGTMTSAMRRQKRLDLLIVVVAGTALVWSGSELWRSRGDFRIELREPVLPMTAKKGETVKIRGAVSRSGSGTIRIHGIAPC